MIEINEEDFATLAICAIRYCHGRQTYMPSLVMSIVAPNLKELSDRNLAVLLEDCDFQEKFNLYGDNLIDRPNWLNWKQKLLDEKKRREGESNS